MKRIGEPILTADRITLAFGGVTALNGISIEIRRHEILAIIGPNGAGKTSMLNVINGFYHPQAGTITWKGETRRQMRPYHAAAQGIARTFQNVALFRGMTTLDNVMTGRLLRMHRNFLWQAIHVGPAEREELEHRAYAERIIDFLEIQAIRKTPVGRLPYGLQKRVELGRALAMEPELLLLDEPMAGMNVEEKEDMCRFILDINDEFGTTIALIEHDMGVVMDISDRVVVLDYGRKIADGPPDEVRASSEVIAAYLGVPHESEDHAAPPPRCAGLLRNAVEAKDRSDGPPRGGLPHPVRQYVGQSAIRARGHHWRAAERGHVLARRARLRADLQGVGRVQFRPGHDGAVRCLDLRRDDRARRADLGRLRHRRSRSWCCSPLRSNG